MAAAVAHGTTCDQAARGAAEAPRLKKATTFEVLSSEEVQAIEKKIYPVYNPSNIYITEADVRKILKKGGIETGSKEDALDIGDLAIWQRAFVHSSYCANNERVFNEEKYFGRYHEADFAEIPDSVPGLQEESSETLEWMGDGILQGVIAHYLYNRFPEQQEGFLTRLRSKLVKTDSLSILARKLGFGKFLILSQHVEIVIHGRTNNTNLEDAFEGFIGAMMSVYGREDYGRGFQMCYNFIIAVMEKYIDIVPLIVYDDNYKDQLMRYFHKEFRDCVPAGSHPLPRYELVEVFNIRTPGGMISRRHHVAVYDLKGVLIGRGIQKTKQDAERMAAKAALNHYGIYDRY